MEKSTLFFLCIAVLIGLPTYFTLSWLSTKLFSRNSFLKKHLPWAGTLVMIPIIFISLSFLFIYSVTYFPKRKFDKTSWDRNPEKRFEMVDHLIANELLIGQPKSKIEKMLGDCSNEMNPDVCSYYIGWLPRFITMDPSSIILEFEDNKVSCVYTVEH